MKSSVISVIVVLCMLVVASSGCTERSTKYAQYPSNIGTTEICTPFDYGNGVFYFPCTSAKFGNSLSAWIKQYPNLTIQAVTPDDPFGYGIAGYFVVTTPYEEKP